MGLTKANTVDWSAKVQLKWLCLVLIRILCGNVCFSWFGSGSKDSNGSFWIISIFVPNSSKLDQMVQLNIRIVFFFQFWTSFRTVYFTLLSFLWHEGEIQASAHASVSSPFSQEGCSWVANMVGLVSLHACSNGDWWLWNSNHIHGSSWCLLDGIINILCVHHRPDREYPRAI